MFRSLQQIYPDLEICEKADEAVVKVEDTEWYQDMAKSMTPGKKLQARRKNAGYTLTQLAEKSGVAKSNLSAMENGAREIGKAMAQRLADALDCDFRSLL